MCYVFRDIDVRFSARDGGIWLHHKGETNFLLLKDCVHSTNLQGRNSHNGIGTRDITKLTFTFYSTPSIRIVFTKGILSYIRTGKTATQRFHQLQNNLLSLGYCTFDLS